MYKIVVATNNTHKVSEIRKILNPFGIDALTMKEAHIVPPDVDENGTNYYENALIKASSIKDLTNLPIIADDSGIEITSLNNEPGLHSARFADSFGGHEKAIEYILKEINGKDRSARFICDIVLLNVSDKPIKFEAIVNGTIAEKVDGSGGFGYDPIFVENSLNKTYASMSEDEKNKVSHRGKALELLIKYLKENRLA